MLSLIRSRTTCLHKINNARAVLRIAQFSSTRYVAETPGLGFGSLSVPIPIDSKNRIALKERSAPKVQAKAQVAASKETVQDGEISAKERGRRQLRNRKLLERRKRSKLRAHAEAGKSATKTEEEGNVATNQEDRVERYAAREQEPQPEQEHEQGQDQEEEDGLSSISARFKELDRSQAGPSTKTKSKPNSRQRRAARRTTSAEKSDNVPNTDFAPEEIEEIVNQSTKNENENEDPARPKPDILASGRIQADQVNIEEVTPMRKMKVARLAHGLHRVLFSPGVHPHRDLRSGIWNFPSEFSQIPTPKEYAFDRSPKYITPSQDEELLSLASREECKFIGSTSTLTGAFSHIYFAISGGKGVDLSTFSQSFASERSDFTSGAEIPACLILGPLGQGRYYVDSDKQFDTENILSEYGVILEKLLVTDKNNFKRFLNSSPPESVTEAERNEKEAYRYSKFGNLMMRSQLDCQDDRLPGSGVFDIKTRACLPIRHDRANYLHNSQYSILKDKGAKLSFEKEYYDIVRAGMLKWSLQARIGGMDGIFVAYHNCNRLFGFQYLPMAEIDDRIFGGSEMGQQAFNLVVSLFETLIQHCADAFPGKEVSIVIRKNPIPESSSVIAYVTPTSSEKGKGDQVQAFTMSFTSFINGRRIRRLLDNDTTQPQEWSVEYTITKSPSSSLESTKTGLRGAIKDIKGISSVSVPEGKSIEEMSTISPSIRWKNPDKRIMELRKEAKDSAGVYGRMKKNWKDLAAWWAP